jgi:hypothetical protein
MRKTLRKGLVVVAAAMTAIGLTTAPASAAPPYVVSGGPSVSASSGDTFLVLKRGNPPMPVATLRCETVTAQATVPNNTYGGLPQDIGDITSSSWLNCEDDDFGLTFTVSPSHPWNLVLTAEGPDANTHLGAVENANASINGILGCTANFQGNAPGRYVNSGNLILNPADGNNTLRVTSASCLGIIQTGDVAEFNGNFAVNPVITVTRS